MMSRNLSSFVHVSTHQVIADAKAGLISLIMHGLGTSILVVLVGLVGLHIYLNVRVSSAR